MCFFPIIINGNRSIGESGSNCGESKFENKNHTQKFTHQLFENQTGFARKTISWPEYYLIRVQHGPNLGWAEEEETCDISFYCHLFVTHIGIHLAFSRCAARIKNNQWPAHCLWANAPSPHWNPGHNFEKNWKWLIERVPIITSSTRPQFILFVNQSNDDGHPCVSHTNTCRHNKIKFTWHLRCSPLTVLHTHILGVP